LFSSAHEWCHHHRRHGDDGGDGECSTFKRRHHCRGCGKVFCADCSSCFLGLPPDFGYKTPQRTCRACYLYVPPLPFSLYFSKYKELLKYTYIIYLFLSLSIRKHSTVDYAKKYDTFGPEDAPVREARTCLRFSWPRRLTLGLGLGRSFTVGRAAARSRGHPQIVRPPNRSPQGLLSPRPARHRRRWLIFIYFFFWTQSDYRLVVPDLPGHGSRDNQQFTMQTGTRHSSEPVLLACNVLS
jgi:hypothetical protein